MAARAFRPISRVLVAWDGGPSAMRAVDHIARSALYEGLAVSVATVGSASGPVRKGLEAARAILAAAGLDAGTEILPGQPESALGELVETTPYDLSVMGAYGHTRIRSL